MAFAEKRFSCFASEVSSEGENVNLVPIMNLFVVLIPFLLMSAAFFHISVINASVPALKAEKTDLAKTEDAVTMMVQVLPEGYRITASSDTLPRSKLDALRAEVPRKGESLDLSGFSRQLLASKRQYPKSDTLILVPQASVLYEEIIQTMDAARQWEEADEETGTIQVDLFPNVVISGML